MSMMVSLMSNKLKYFLALFLVLGLSSILAKPVFLSSQYNNKPIQVTLNQSTVTFVLPSNRSTGYGWFLAAYDHKLIQPIRARYKAPKNTMPGAPGKVVWTFRIKKAAHVPQLTAIKMVYARPWDISDAHTKIIHLMIA